MLLKAEEISFKYNREEYILEKISFQVESGEVVGLTAPSGFGKTTLAKILAGYQKPENGHVTLEGLDTSSNDYNPVQLIFQHPEIAVNPKWKMRKVLAEAKVYSEELMEPLGIKKEWLNRWPSELSGGELQKFCVLRALSPQTKFLIADEMTTMLDTITQAQIWNTVLSYCRQHNIGVVVISHDQDLLEQTCDRIQHMGTAF